jgi:GTPase
MEHKSGFVNIIGKPNVGKSTATNLLLGEKLSIVTHKAQTTRHRILALINEENFQIVLSDTPGIISDPKYKMQESMNQFAFSTFEDADVMLLMVVKGERFEEQPFVLDNIQSMKGTKILLLNKADQLSEAEIEEELTHWKKLEIFDSCLAISALEEDTRALLLEQILAHLPEHPNYFPKDQLSDKTERFFVSEMIREQILLLYHQEIPYSAEVVVEDFKEDEEAQPPIIRIRAEIYVNRKTQKSILIGKGGSSIKALGIASREALEKFFNCKIYLELFVKVKENWRDDERTLRNFGYNQ